MRYLADDGQRGGRHDGKANDPDQPLFLLGARRLLCWLFFIDRHYKPSFL